MGVAETTGIVFIVALVLQGLFRLLEHFMNKDSADEKNISNKVILDAISNKKCGLNNRQAEQLTKLHDLHNMMDADGTPLWYVPRSWAETQKEIANLVRGVADLQHKTLNLIEQLEKKLED